MRTLSLTLTKITLAILFLTAFFFPSVSHACICYNESTPQPTDPTPYCITQCANDMAATSSGEDGCEFGEPDCEFDNGFCYCTPPAALATFTCEDVCVDAGLIYEPPTSTAPSTPVSALSPSASSKPLLTPKLSVDIPTVQFSEGIIEDGVIKSNYLGEYIAGIYKWLIGIATLIAIVLIMVGGFLYSLSLKAQGTKLIRNAITGLILLLSTYTILAIVNPRFVILEMPEFKTILTIALPETEDDVVNGGSVATSFKKPSGNNISGPGINFVPEELTQNIESVARALQEQGFGLSITSSLRTVEKQKELIYENCQNPPGSDKCNPKPGKPNTCILKNLDPKNCPHTTGRALDIWGTKGGKQCIIQRQCTDGSQNDPCRKNECQAALISAMKSAGFCNLAGEAWHFEKPKMSTKCN
jgi:D-alanyl-D-alanine dipeptidase